MTRHAFTAARTGRLISISARLCAAVAGFCSPAVEHFLNPRTLASAEKAKKVAAELKESIDSATEQLKEWLGDKKDLLDPVVEKLKTNLDGKTVTAEFTIPGKLIEKLLAKES